ncbi:MAG: metal ABC transporter substrate-binding protein [Acidimicrobiaceae bacterium]|nr:metal ABC transporter substrate-binding protein [Acidimicrobiaceae bacterium]
MKNRPGPSPVIVDCQARPRRSWKRVALAVFAALALSAASCGGDEGDAEGDGQPAAAPTAPTILVTTGIWADVVSNVACGDMAVIETLIPVGGDPHGYEPSLRDRESMENAALVVTNGLELEEGLEDTLEAVAEGGTPVFEFAEGMEPIPFAFEGAHHGEGEEEEGHDEDEGEEEEGDHGEEEEGHGSGGDPHVWFDPQRVSGALPGLARVLTAEVGLDAAAVDACLAGYQAELEAVDAEIAAKVEQLPAGSRKLVTNHEALGYFADRYGFEVIGTVIPTPSSMAQASPAGLEQLAEIIEHEGIKAIFAETLHSVDDVEALAARVGDVDVVTLYTGSLGPSGSGAENYVGFMRTNAESIVDALG